VLASSCGDAYPAFESVMGGTFVVEGLEAPELAEAWEYAVKLQMLLDRVGLSS